MDLSHTGSLKIDFTRNPPLPREIGGEAAHGHVLGRHLRPESANGTSRPDVPSRELRQRRGGGIYTLRGTFSHPHVMRRCDAALNQWQRLRRWN